MSGQYPIHQPPGACAGTELGKDYRPYLFATRQSDVWPMSASTIYALFRQYAEIARLARDRCHLHVVWHSIAVHLMNAGWDIADVQDWLGQRDVSSTMVYAAVTNERREANCQRLLESEEIAGNDAS